MSKPIKLFIVEGEKRESRFIHEMANCFFEKGRYESKIINLSADQNIYMLFKKLEEDDFETDIVEIVRENIDTAREKLTGISRQSVDEVFLFFDYDIHQDNLKKDKGEESADAILRRMLSVFDNETENGKLYISYPMVEALYDYKTSACDAFSKCYFPIENVQDYKRQAGESNANASQHFDFLKWQDVLNVFYLKLKCLFDLDQLEYEYYRRKITPLMIYKKEKDLLNEKNVIFVLSAFPEFLFDYFKKDFWNKMTPIKRFNYSYCVKSN